MPTTEELLEQLEAEAQSETPVCVIDPETRTITVPPEYQLIGVEGDKLVERIPFRCPKIVGDNKDLSKDFVLFINYQNAKGDPDAYRIKDMQAEGDDITFTWPLGEGVTKYQGKIQFSFAAIIPGDTEKDPDKNRWNTTINTDCTCLIGLKCTEAVAESNPDALVQIWVAIDELKAGGGGSVDPEQIKQAVNGYLEENPVSGMTAEQEQQLEQNTTDVADLKSALNKVPSDFIISLQTILQAVSFYDSNQASNIQNLSKYANYGGSGESGETNITMQYSGGTLNIDGVRQITSVSYNNKTLTLA